MKVSYPLSLKVSLWLMLNLLLLAGVGIGFFVVNGGLRWDALVAGPSGERMQNLANVIAGEAAAATGEARNEVLKRFGAAYNAEFFLFNPEGRMAGRNVELPEAVRARLEFRGSRGGPPGGYGERRGFGPRGEGFRGEGFRPGHEAGEFEGPRRREPLSTEFGPPESAEKGRPPPPELGQREPPPFNAAMPLPPPEVLAGRFVIRAGTPAAYWVGLRVPFVSGERARFVPARLIVRVGSLWALLHLLNLQSWVLAGTGVLALSVLFWLPLVRSITRSVGQLTTATEQIAEGRFETRVTTHRRDELGKLGDSVNRMASRLDAHMTGQKRFLGDVAHELCSPLARLQMATGILAEQAPKELQETVTDVRDEVQQMSSLVNELLAFTKAGMQPRDVAIGIIELEPLAREVLAREDAGQRVTLNCPPALTAKADPDLLSRALGNLVRNALRYAGDTGPITVTAAPDEKGIAIVVEDNGPGVPAADLDRLGEPFFRPELARTRESGGVGLGLAIVRTSIAACGGEVRFANRVPQGFRAELRLAAS